MGRIMAIDYGQKRCGIAVTDIYQISANPLSALNTAELFDFILDYCQKENVEKIVFGMPTHPDGTPTSLYKNIKHLETKLKRSLNIETDFEDESFTSHEARQILNQIASRKKRKEKELTDLISAVLILQRYLNHI